MSYRTQIRNFLVKKLDVPTIPSALERLAAIGFQPRQIFDVGAYRGDFARQCLSTWSDTNVACFEALPQKVNELQQLAVQNANIRVFPGLLGATAQDNVPLNEVETASSVLQECIQQGFSVSYHSMRTVDQIVVNHFEGESPDFLKLDVQGYELEVLKGAEQSLPQIQVILAEVNFLDIHQNVPLVSEMMAWLHQRGWAAFDICGITRRPLDRTLWQADFVFVPYNSPFRADKRYICDAA